MKSLPPERRIRSCHAYERDGVTYVDHRNAAGDLVLVMVDGVPEYTEKFKQDDRDALGVA